MFFSETQCKLCPHKKGATNFSLQILQIYTDFYNFSCTTSQENAKVLDVRISGQTFILLLLYRVKL